MSDIDSKTKYLVLKETLEHFQGKNDLTNEALREFGEGIRCGPLSSISVQEFREFMIRHLEYAIENT